MSDLAGVVVLGSCALLMVAGVMLFVGWRLVVLDKEQAEQRQELLRLQQEVGRRYQQSVNALATHVDIVEASLHDINDRLDEVTPWITWWSSELARRTTSHP